MKKTMVVLAHPDMENSTVNKKWIKELQKCSDKILIHDLHKEYPNCIFNVDKEHELLENVDNVIFQFPLYWYSSPPILKKWLDDVLLYGWAYGDDEMANYKMKDNTVFFNDIAVYRKNHFGVMVPADIKSFKIINDRYAKDRYTVYFMGEEIRDSDLETFEVVGRGISKDKNSVYKYWTKLNDLDIPLDIPTVKVFNEKNIDYLNTYLKDKNGIYYSGSEAMMTFLRKLDIVDEKTFQELEKGYAKDKDRIYYRGKEIKNADMKTFRIMKEDENGNRYYSEDKNNIYYEGRKIENADMKTFEILNPYWYSKDRNRVYYDGEVINDIDVNSMEIIDREYIRDKNNVYHYDKRLEGRDAKTFEKINSYYTKDRNNVYYDDKKIENVDVETFEIIKSYYAKDKNNVYCRIETIEGADSDTFEIVDIDKGLTRDKNNKYSYCKKIDDEPYSIIEKDVKGNIVERFKPLSPYETPDAIEQICYELNKALDKKEVDSLLLIPIYIHDFLCIHPFSDGNGRMSRLLTTLLLYRQGYVVGKYISLESIIEKNKASYYIALEKSGIGWHKNKENPLPFIKYILRTILAAYIDFEDRVTYIDEKIATIELVKEAVKSKLGKFTKRDIMELVPSVGKTTIENMLKQLIGEGYIERHGKGRATFYVKK